jgi:hypothetical protein
LGPKARVLIAHLHPTWNTNREKSSKVVNLISYPLYLGLDISTFSTKARIDVARRCQTAWTPWTRF